MQYFDPNTHPANLSAARGKPRAQHSHTHTLEGLSWPVRRQNLPIVMLVTFLCSAYGDEAVWIVISRRFLVNLAKFFFFLIKSVISYE